ncbi:HutD family protein [Aliiroseovarius sp. F47248L]|uniref:HutD/Ves family protein n=1 Tax=Aliiroseovarius sp. F47248L TaxID=2926420 RepID=UPI001FF4DECD|nr:HutD family protein [Aliiroseovarius sp. F47248L]MCK0140682.1 HutD family protein [Aliiroseovarius sp. F47248L]
MQIIRRRDLVETPWKNGGGITRNIAEERDDRGALWRLSMADVDGDGTFSSFPGLTRILTVIKGDGMVLHGPDGDLQADYANPVRFDGAAPVTATLTQGPIRDFNLMFDTARCAGDAQIVRNAGPHQVGQAGQTGVLHVIAGTASVHGADLGVGDTAISTAAPLRFDLVQDAVALTITLRPQG